MWGSHPSCEGAEMDIFVSRGVVLGSDPDALWFRPEGYKYHSEFLWHNCKVASLQHKILQAAFYEAYTPAAMYVFFYLSPGDPRREMHPN